MTVSVFLLVALAGCDGGSDEPPSRDGQRAETRSLEPERLAGRWWSWASRRPDGEDPVTDTSGANCGQDQPDDVFFLAGTFGGSASRRCDVPVGRPLFFPVLNRVCSLDEGEPNSVAQECGQGLREARLEVTLDGRPVRQVVYVESPAFELEPHPRSASPGAGRSVAVGHHVLLDPLDPGSHRLRFSGRGGGFALDVDYSLRVR